MSGDSALYAVPDINGEGNAPVEEKFTNTPVEGVISTSGIVVYPLPEVITFKLVTTPPLTFAVAVAPFPEPPVILI